MAKNSAFNNSQIPPALKNDKTKKSADKTGLREVITFKAENIRISEKNKKGLPLSVLGLLCSISLYHFFIFITNLK